MTGFSEVTDLRLQSMTRAIESIMVFIAAIVANVFLPQLIINMMYSQEELLTLTEQPAILEMLPIITFGVSAAFFLFTVVGNVMRNTKAAAKKAEQALDGCCGGGCCSEDNKTDDLSKEELRELESIVEEALKPKAAKKAAKAKTTKSAKKTK